MDSFPVRRMATPGASHPVVATAFDQESSGSHPHRTTASTHQDRSTSSIRAGQALGENKLMSTVHRGAAWVPSSYHHGDSEDLDSIPKAHSGYFQEAWGYRAAALELCQ